MNFKNSVKNEIAMEVKNVSKVFKVPHRKIDSMKGAFVNAFKKNYYEEFNALDNVSFKVKKGEFLGIIGHNGAGKSTLLKILASVYKPTSGKIKINGMISPFLELGIGFNPELSGRDNIYLNATVLGLTKKEIEKKFDEIVAFAELEEFIDQQIKNYSSGMQARLAFSVSIHANREILLMDEVLAVGDSAFQEKCLDIFRSYKDRGRTVILVTHGIGTVREYCDRALLLDKGKILDIGDVDEVCDAYIRNNMTKEERKELEKKERIEKEEKERKEKIEKEGKNKEEEDVESEPIDKPQRITGIEVRNNKGEKLKKTVRGDSFFVDVDIEIEEIKKNLFLAVQIFDKNSNFFISGNNTQIDNFDCDWKKGRNSFRIYFNNHSLNNGNFYIRAVLFKYKANESIVINEFSSLENNYFFTVERRDAGGGIMFVEHNWEKIDEK